MYNALNHALNTVRRNILIDGATFFTDSKLILVILQAIGLIIYGTVTRNSKAISSITPRYGRIYRGLATQFLQTHFKICILLALFTTYQIQTILLQKLCKCKNEPVVFFYFSFLADTSSWNTFSISKRQKNSFMITTQNVIQLCHCTTREKQRWLILTNTAIFLRYLQLE